MNRLILFLLFAMYSIPNSSLGQEIETFYRNPADSSFNCYRLYLPKTEPKGLLVRDYSSLPPLSGKSPYQWRDLALIEGLAVLITVSSSYFPELCYDERNLELIDQMIHEILLSHDIPSNIFIGGISASGTRALRFTQYCHSGKSKFNTRIQGVFAVDSPLDLERFCMSVDLNKDRFKAGMRWEAELMDTVFDQRLGPLKDNKSHYRRQSVYSFLDPESSHADKLLHCSVLLIHEPDLDWWSIERGASYFDINSFDLSGLYTYLLEKGHPDIQIISTSGKGFDRNGDRNCHSWTIVDEKNLINWITERLKE